MSSKPTDCSFQVPHPLFLQMENQRTKYDVLALGPMERMPWLRDVVLAKYLASPPSVLAATVVPHKVKTRRVRLYLDPSLFDSVVEAKNAALGEGAKVARFLRQVVIWYLGVREMEMRVLATASARDHAKEYPGHWPVGGGIRPC